MFVKVIENGCPVCGGEVRGNTKVLYYCKECSLLFRSFQLKKPYIVKEVITDNKKILKKYSEDDKYKEKESHSSENDKQNSDDNSSNTDN